MANKNEKITISLQANVSDILKDLNRVYNELKVISQTSSININNAELKKSLQIIEQYKKALRQSGAIGDNNSLNLKQLSAIEKNTGTSLDGIIKSSNEYFKAANKNIEVTAKEGEMLTRLEAPAKRASTAIDKIGVSLVNSLRYNIVNNFVDSFLSKGGDVVNLLSEVDDRLTQIQIVSGKSAGSVAGVREDALIGAKNLSSTTQEVLSAYETYYQQGLSTNEARARAEATIKAASVSDQSVQTTAEQVTAVLNGFNISATNTVDVLGKMANIGAKTATDFSEISKAMQKVASASDVAGLSLDQTLAAMATISSVTREAPETIGTSLNAIIGRIGNLKIDKEYSSALEEAYKNTGSGLTLFDKQTGLLKETGTILTELAEKWNILDINQKRTIATQMAGTRQANRLFALFENWDMYTTFLGYAENSGDALEEQFDIYLNSVEASQKRLQTAWDNFWLNLFDEKTLKGLYDFGETLVTIFDNSVQSAGGLLSIVRAIGGIGARALSKQVGEYVGAKTLAYQERKYASTTEGEEDFQITQTNVNKALKEYGQQDVELLNIGERQLYLSEEQGKQYSQLTEELFELTKQTLKYKEILESDVFKNISYKTESSSGEQSTSEIRSARDFTNFVSRIVSPTIKESSIILSEDDASVKESLAKAISTSAKSFTSDNENAETVFKNINIIKKVLTQFKDSKNKLFTDILKTTKAEFEILSNSTEDIRNQFPDLFEENGDIKSSVTDVLNKRESKKRLTKDDKSVLKQYDSMVKAEGTTEIISKSLYDLINSGFNKAALGLDGKVDDEQFFNALIRIINENFKRMMGEAQEGGASIVGQAKEEEKAQNFLNDNKDKAGVLARGVGNIKKAAEAVKLTQRLTTGFTMLASAASGVNQLMTENLDTQEQLSVTVNTLGSALAPLPNIWGAFGMALSTIGPMLIEVFDIGASEAKKLQRQIEDIKASNEALTLSLKEQKSELANVSASYDILVEQYKNGKLDVQNLTEEQKQQYEQVAEYVSTYAPELIKYYDIEGNAVLDLSDKLNTLTNSKKNYLEQQADRNEFLTYNRLRETSGQSADVLSRNYALNLKNVEESQQKIAELQKESLETGKDNNEAIADYETKLSNARDSLSSMASDWNDMFSKPITLGTEGFSDLSTELQNTLTYVSSYSNYLQSDSLNTDLFAARVQTIVEVTSNLSDKTQKKFTEMDDSIRDAIFSMSTNLDYGAEKFKKFFDTINEKSFLTGSFIEGTPLTEEEIDNRNLQKRDRDRIQEYISGKDVSSDVDVSENESLQELKTVVLTSRETMSQSIQELAGAVEDEETSQKLEQIADNLANSGLLETYEAVSEALGSLDELKNTIVVDTTSEYLDSMSAWRDSIVEYAESSAEAYNSVAENFLEMQKRISEGQGDMSDEQFTALQDSASTLYLALNSQNDKYYENWKNLNAETLDEIQRDWGINADNYRTYSEYKTALDEITAQKKLYIEIATNKGIEDAEEILFNTKKQNAVNELLSYKNTETAAILLASNSTEAKVNLDKAEKIAVLEGEKKKLEGIKKSLQGQVNQNALAMSEQVRQYDMAIDKINKPLAGLANMGVSQISKVGTTQISAKSLTSMIDKAISQIDKTIADTNAKMAEGLKDQEGYKKALASLRELQNIEDKISNDFTYQRGDYGKIDFKDISNKATPNNIKNAGKKGGKKDSSKKDVEDMSVELDILRPYIIALDELGHQLDIIKEQKSQVWGKQYVDYLNQELDLNKKTLNVLKEEKKTAQDYANVLKAQLSAKGVKFTDYGAISNYNEIIKSKVNAANKKTGDSKKEAQEEVKNFQKLMDEYEKYALKTVRDIEKEILKTKNTIAEETQEKIEYYVEIIVKAKDNKNDLIEFLADVKKHNKGEVNFSVDVSSNAEQLLTSLNALQEIESKTSVDNLIKEVTQNPDLQGMTDKQLEIIQNRISELQKLGSELIKFEEAFAEAFSEAFDEAMDLLDDQIAKYDDILNQYNYILDLTDKIGGQKDLDFNIQTYDKIIDIYKNNLEATKKLAEDIKTARDQFEVGTEDWQIANEKYLKAQSNVIDQEKALTDALENKLDSTVSIGRDKIENILFNGSTLDEAERQLEKLNKLRDKYLDKERKIYALDTMKYQIMQDMEDYEYNPAAQKELEDWMNKELDYLNNKKDLTQDDLDLAQKQYDVLKARIDMENAYNNKKYTATLQRNADGTYGYMYIQDTSQYEAASKNYRDAIDELYNYSLQRNEDLQKENIELKQEALEEYDRIVAQLKAGMITSEEATKLLQETFNQLQENLRENANEQELISQNAVAATQLQILMNELMNTESMDRIQNISQETQQIIKDNLTAAGMDYDDFVNSKLYQELSREDMFTADVIEEWNKLDELINNDMDSIAEDFNFENEDSMISKIVNSINSAYSEFNKVVNDAFNNAVDREQELIKSTTDLNKQTESLNKKLQDEINKVTDLKLKYNDLRSSVTKAIDDITNSLNKLVAAQTGIKNEANKGKPSSSGSGSSSGGGGSSSGSGSSSSGGSGSASAPKKGNAVKVKSGRRWYHDSKGKNPSGPTTPYANRTLYIVNTSSNAYPYAVGTTKNVSSALGWLKKTDLVGYDTGGYTGNWFGNEGKLALLHKKEIILKEDDSKNFLKGIELSNQLLKDKIQSYKINNTKNNETVNYNEFKIDFPNATNSDEIRKAIEGLSTMATQYLGRKK